MGHFSFVSWQKTNVPLPFPSLTNTLVQTKHPWRSRPFDETIVHVFPGTDDFDAGRKRNLLLRIFYAGTWNRFVLRQIRPYSE